MRYPEFLSEGGTIGFVAPSFGCATEPYKTAFGMTIKRFEKEGYTVELGPNCYKDNGIGISNTPQECGKELTQMYESNVNDVLRGKGCKNNNGVVEKQVHGYDTWERESLKNEENPAPQYNLTEKKILRKYVGGDECDTEIAFEGRLVGGCMDCLVNLTGTSFDKVKEFNERYAVDGIIWFLESCDLNVFAIRRAMWQMDNAGWFKNVKGFLIGRPLCYGQEMMGLDQYRAVTGIAAKYNVPVIMDCDFGHLSPSMPIVSGVYTQVKVKDNDLSLNYRFC